jgi:hypothetical protein
MLAQVQRSQSRNEFDVRDDARNVLHDLRKDFRLGIIWMGQGDFVRPELAELGIHHHFDVVVVSSDHGYPKPGARLFQHAANAFGTPVSGVVHVGATADGDGQGAARAGMPSVVIGARASAARIGSVAALTVRHLNDVSAATRAIARDTAETARGARLTNSLPTPTRASATFSAVDLEHVSRRIVARLGTPDAAAAEVARHLARAKLAGHGSHGVMRLTQYAQIVANGTVRPGEPPRVIAEKSATVLVDGGCTFGQIAGAYAS